MNAPRRRTQRPCGVEGCEKPHNSHGYCVKHGRRFLRYGDPLGNFRRAPFPESCSVSGCEKPRARANGLCQMHNWRLEFHGDVNYEPYPVRPCGVPGCGRKHSGHGYCQLHLNRRNKGIPLDLAAKEPPPGRYRIVTRRDHPLAMKNGRVAVHRMVLFDATGGARMPCFWCGSPVEWFKDRFDPGALHVDHLDHDPRNNYPTNLLPACNSCNAGRIKGFAAVRIPVYEPGIPEHGNDTHILVGT